MGGKLLSALALTAACSTAQALDVRFDGLIQFASGGSVHLMQDNLFERQEYRFAGARVIFQPWQWDPEEQEWIYLVQPGDTFSWRWHDVADGRLVAWHDIRYLGGENQCWSNGHCGPGGRFSAGAATGVFCMPDESRRSVATYFNGKPIGSDAFRATRFVPRVEPEISERRIEPRRTRSAEGQSTLIGGRVVDDLGCNQALPGVEVTIEATVRGGTNGQIYLAENDIGTGRFHGLGDGAVLNPDGPQQKDTVIRVETDAGGYFQARYQAEDHGAEERIRFTPRRPATVADPEVFGSESGEDLLIAVPGLVRITSELAHVGFGDRGGCPHDPKPHWLTPGTLETVITLADIYYIETGRMLSLNDASLEHGGVIANKLRDISPTKEARDAHCHDSHRQGIDIDFNSVDMGRVNLRVATIEFRGEPWTLLKYLNYLAGRFDGIDFHGTSSIHYRFPD
ncbi:hypothetical protein [Thioalkalivibrio thiocyanodenitrificans]|uniref:hypothetical protein n=1 Tax=Thioalkalivibrio thiocyanodenitrificans TaxID=243063 RepID=UPI0012EA6302|nr:hypothetical protein [Thioalkalivibrio thiocyanodenitrificans]